MSEFWNDMERQALYIMPLEQLGLKAGVINSLQNMGIQSLGDCVDYFENSAAFDKKSNIGTSLWMRLIVAPRLKNLGFWKYVNRKDED